ncbi:MAG: hypothetical protein HUU28_03880 [Planctomycetaceae bacterium]|nr:hypothetical protein [Planctomycetaceae bacterium]
MSSPTSEGAKRDAWGWKARALVAAFAFLAYWPAFGGDYVLDGAIVVRDNPLLEPFEPLRIAGLDWWEGTGRPGGLYRPIPLVLLAALKALGPGAIAFVNVTLLGLLAMLRFELLRKLLAGASKAETIAACAAVFAAVHPIHAELAGGQVGLADNLANVVSTAAALVLAGRQTIGKLGAAAVLAALAVLSKESGVLVVPLALLFELLRETQEERGKRMLCAGLATATGIALALALRLAAIGTLASADDPVHAGFPLMARLASAFAAFSSWSLRILVAPWKQLAVVGFQDVPPAESFADPRALAGFATFLALGAGALFAWKRGSRAVAFGLAWFLVAWFPTSNVLVPTGAIAASRFLAPGLIGLTFVMALGIGRAWERGILGRALSIALAIACGPVLALVAWSETAKWKDARALLESQAARAPQSAYELLDLARELENEAPGRALELYERALATPEVHVPGTNVPPEDLLESYAQAALAAGGVSERVGDGAKARERYRAAIEFAKRGETAASVLPFREDWKRQRLVALEKLAGIELRDMRDSVGAERAAALERIGASLDAAEAIGVRSAELVRLRAVWFDRQGDSAGRRRVIESAWNTDASDPLVRILWASELRQSGRVSEALTLELDVLEQQFDAYDRSRALAIAREAATGADAALAARGRALLQRLAQPARPDDVSAEADRLLRSLAPAR